MKKLEDFGVKKTQLGNILGGCKQTGYRTSAGSTGTDTWCDSNGDGQVDKKEIYDYIEDKRIIAPRP